MVINLDTYEQFNKKFTLKEASKNGCKKEDIQYMTESEMPVINFDAVKDEYVKHLKVKEVPASNDALFVYGEELYFIEFKDGNMQKEQYTVSKKIYDSICIFCDITKQHISFTRKHMNYILVYNKENSKEFIERLSHANEKLNEKEVQFSSSFNDIACVVGCLGEMNMDIFGLRKKFANLYFRDVFTYDKTEFDPKKLFA